ncbi:cytochrome b561 [Rouxiella sp. S1S-2]|uniref:cytochrome b561 n=1 Tax=Rouxiella sp. S1S-2 TaxID=2653856 RepID=UPI00126559FE|nr:cytochrome b561 [Rouxiella sp. S1S-2]KAB7895943.1 cytochrome b561 [Rouxiella sp. S1S-2]
MRTKYKPVQIALHWLIFLLVAATYSTIELRGYIPKSLPQHQWLTLLHFSFGASVLAMMVLRVFVRLMYVTPAINPAPKVWQHRLGELMHLTVYILFISIPILGVLSLYFKGDVWTLFTLNMPVSFEHNPLLSKKIKSLHELMANCGYYLIGLHAAAALFHHYCLHDNTLLRMMPGNKSINTQRKKPPISQK